MGSLMPRLTLKGNWGGQWCLSFDAGDISHMVIFEELVIDRTWDLDLLPFYPDLIIDAGAHVGFFSSLAGVRFPQAKCVCIEPDPKNLGWLKLNLAVNGINAEVFEGVALDKESEIQFSPGLSYGGKIADEFSVLDRSILVKSISLPSVIQRYSPRRLLLKIDIEGAEELVLPSILSCLDCDCFLFLETHAGQKSFDEFKQLCERAGFKVKLTRSHGQMCEFFAIRHA